MCGGQWGEKVNTSRFYQHRDLYGKCQACRVCVDKGYLLTPFEQRRLPLPWQGSAGPRVKVLFLFAKPSFTKFSPRFSEYTNLSAARAMLDDQYENHAIAFKRRQTMDNSSRNHARRIASILLESPEASVSDFDDYLFTSLARCAGSTVTDLKFQEQVASECLELHAASLLDRLPNLQWIVLVGGASHRMLSLPAVWVKFRKAFGVQDLTDNFRLPPLAGGVSDVISLNDRLRLVAVPRFNRGTFYPEHYRRVLASSMARPPLEGAGAWPA